MAIFLQLEGIQSDATDARHTGWIACSSMYTGTNRPMFTQTGKGMQRESSVASLEEITIGMPMHKGSPKVFMASVVGKAKSATIHVTRTGGTGGAENYLEMKLTNVFVCRYEVNCVNGIPHELIRLNFTKMESRYVPNKSDGTPGDPIPVGFDLATGKKL
jgi:type VI secretion system secreted protein Hcp